MPIDVLDLQKRSRQVVVSLTSGDGEITVTYLPNKYTSRIHNELVAQTANEDPSANVMVTLLDGIIEQWDVTSGGEPFPPTADNLLSFSPVILADIARQIVEDVAGANGAEGNGR